MRLSKKKLYHVSVYSGKGDITVYEGMRKRDIQFIKKDIKARNKRLRQQKHPEVWTFKVSESSKN
jgi:hypothetical protein